MAESAEVGTKVVMAMAACYIDDVYRPAGTVFVVSADMDLGEGKVMREVPAESRQQQDMRAEALKVPQRPEFEILNQAKRAKAAHMREQGFGDTVVTPNILPAQHQQEPAPPSLAPKPKAKATAKAK